MDIFVSGNAANAHKQVVNKSLTTEPVSKPYKFE